MTILLKSRNIIDYRLVIKIFLLLYLKNILKNRVNKSIIY